MRTRLIAGAMSGTSADGVDIALVRGTTLVHHHHRPYERALRERIFACRSAGAVALADLAKLGRDITLAYAQAVIDALTAAHISAGQVDAIAAHGQTLFHDPPNTIQWFDPSLLAERTGCAVVSDFRRADCAVGGQGAPLVPFADFVLFQHPTITRVLLNIGGIANLTYLRAAGSLDQLIAFDTGPGNCICDDLMRRQDPNGPGYDAGGMTAERGSMIDEMLANMLTDEYFRKSPPKSTDGPAMIALFNQVPNEYSLADQLRTACALTARTIADAVRGFGDVRELIVSGGGTENRTIMRMLSDSLPAVAVRTTDELGVPSAAKEAIAFALLGAATLDGKPSNVPACTGASKRVVLGSITGKNHE